jgi:hypothetical protein
VFENKVLRKIFGPQRGQIRAEWRLLHNRALLSLLLIKYYSDNQIMKNKIGRYVACMEERIGAYKVLVEKPEGKRPHGRPRCRWGDNTKMDLQEIGWGSIDWIYMAQDRDRVLALTNAVMNLHVP